MINRIQFQILMSLVLFTLSSILRADPSTHEISSAVQSGISRVSEMIYLQDEAKRLGVRAWLFGGTAASFSHYVRQDLERISGNKRYSSSRFDYDYTNIYRSTQDFDIVIDGNADQAKTLRELLAKKYPHLQGNKPRWEVRLLSDKFEDKEPILGSFDFSNQHTDSHSTGMIEVTEPTRGEQRIRDARYWDNAEPPFLKDVANQTLRFYSANRHLETERARRGLNPEIFSVIRFLTKAFQYDLRIEKDSLSKIQEIIGRFQSKQDLKTPYALDWIERNGKKLYQHAVNLEYAEATLESLGLRKKLAEIKNNPNEVDSLAWWMNRRSLVSKPIGTGNGKTAGQLKISTVAHETKDFLAYESITRSNLGNPNVFISRKNHAGENASFGDGFYTRVGREGARATGFTIRFDIDPNATEGTDFIKKDDFIIVLNKNILRVIDESLNLTPLQYFEMLVDKKGFPVSEKGIQERLERRIRAGLGRLQDREKAAIYEFLKQNASTEYASWEALEAWNRTSIAKEFPEITPTSGIYPIRKEIAQAAKNSDQRQLVEYASRAKTERDFSEFMSLLYRNNSHQLPYLQDKLREDGFYKRFFATNPSIESLATVVRAITRNKIAEEVVRQGIENYLKRGEPFKPMLDFILSVRHLETVEELMIAAEYARTPADYLATMSTLAWHSAAHTNAGRGLWANTDIDHDYSEVYNRWFEKFITLNPTSKDILTFFGWYHPEKLSLDLVARTFEKFDDSSDALFFIPKRSYLAREQKKILKLVNLWVKQHWDGTVKRREELYQLHRALHPEDVAGFLKSLRPPLSALDADGFIRQFNEIDRDLIKAHANRPSLCQIAWRWLRRK